MIMITEQPTSTPIFHTQQSNRIHPAPVGLYNNKKKWTQDLCSCCDSPAICCCGLFCGPCLFCQNVSNLGEDACNYCFFRYICGCPLGFAVRALAREKFQVEGNYMEDVVASQCCDPCVQCQVAKEIQFHGL